MNWRAEREGHWGVCSSLLPYRALGWQWLWSPHAHSCCQAALSIAASSFHVSATAASQLSSRPRLEWLASSCPHNLASLGPPQIIIHLSTVTLFKCKEGQDPDGYRGEHARRDAVEETNQTCTQSSVPSLPAARPEGRARCHMAALL